MPRLYRLEERLAPHIAFLCGLQHVLAMFVGVITPPLIICGVLGLDPTDTAFFVSMSLFASGITTFIQIRRFGPVGSGLLSVQGTSFTFVTLGMEAGRAGGFPLILGLAIACSPVEMVLSRFIGTVRRLFPPVVSGSVVLLIGISLIQVGMTDLAGGFGAEDFGSMANLGLGLFVMLTIIALNRLGRGFVRTVSIAVGLLVGYILAAALGRIDFSPVSEAPIFTLPEPLRYGLRFEFAYMIPWIVGYLITTIESIGDLTATSAVSKEPVKGPVYFKRLQGGILADGLGSAIAGLFNSMPTTTFSQNNGVISLTGVASRRAGFVVSVLLAVLGLLPKLAALISVMPRPVLGGATLCMFGVVAVAGFRLIAADGLNPRNEFILAITMALGLGVTLVPDVFGRIGEIETGSVLLKQVLNSLEIVLQSGLAVGGITATILNLILPRKESCPAPG